MSTYAISIGCLLLKRLRSFPLPRARWSLGAFGLPINAFAFVYSCWAIVFVCFPVALPVSAASMNWAIVMFAAVLAIAAAYYVVHGKNVYEGPVVFVRKGDIDDER